MSSSSGPRRHHASSPFQPAVTPPVETFEPDDLVSHDAYGVGRVVNCEPAAVTVDFRTATVRIPSPYNKLEHL